MKPFHAYARLARPSDRMPWRGRDFGVGTDCPGFEIVDTHDSFTLSLIADGSIVLEQPPASPQATSGPAASQGGPEPLSPAAPVSEPHA